MADLDDVNILHGSAPSTGGIVVRKKKSDKDKEPEGPKVSLLGLDKLAGMFYLSFSIDIPKLFFK